DWSRALAKARKATKEMAFDLMDVYSRRLKSVGFRFGEDTPEQIAMEAAFPYKETSDQMAAIEDVKADMQSNKPMDRLICGDVGFGKTEVAMRAAFKATQNKKQVMVLCPTTILAQQHYAAFKDRFEPFGVTIEVLSRFRTPAQQKSALEGFENGSVSILVGTHRLLSRDVNPRDLGLVIIDEEQRFGVVHKEHFKNLRESVDVLTLSATPIPRTLQMSLSGIRDMSLIMTPPQNRRAVEVHVGEWDPDVISDAIRRELARNGQVYYVSNRVNGIEDAVARVAEAAGEARIGVAHGKMSKDKLEGIMEEFSAGKLDVLVATTIIESGIDNPHTNTLIIEDSQRLGLAQMYQLKGRVGRSSVQAYAYFLFPANSALTEEAMLRLNALDENRELGSGLRIALRDLEIRGAGSLLGAEQSGNITAVGFDLFAQMLADAVSALREGRATPSGLPEAQSDIAINIPGPTFLPQEYIEAADERIAWYRSIADCAIETEVDALREDLSKKHPDMPVPAKNLLTKATIRVLANQYGIKSVIWSGGRLTISGIEADGESLKQMRIYAARYDKDGKRFSIPTKYFERMGEDIDLFDEILKLLRFMLGVRD
ncbi:MAG: DEAD/DEAH box helicase, partial [Eggerthellaceae bacterium]|nr:DEAD/DEAH box helicase [Eggerthellaceae bacterium]